LIGPEPREYPKTAGKKWTGATPARARNPANGKCKRKGDRTQTVRKKELAERIGQRLGATGLVTRW